MIIAGYLLVFSEKEGHRRPIDKLIIGSPLQEASALIYIAKDKKYFVETGLEVEIIDYHSGLAAIEGLLDKQIDVALSTDFGFLLPALIISN